MSLSVDKGSGLGDPESVKRLWNHGWSMVVQMAIEKWRKHGANLSTLIHWNWGIFLWPIFRDDPSGSECKAGYFEGVWMIGGLNQFRVLFFQIRNKFPWFSMIGCAWGTGWTDQQPTALHVAACDVIVLPLICRVDSINKVECCTRKHMWDFK
jgi:hypothetical protein